MRKTWRHLAAGLTLATAAVTGVTLAASTSTAPPDTAWGASTTVDTTVTTPAADTDTTVSVPVTPLDTAWG